ncbi:hypothetical protein BHE74_00033849 [Ensete ventricosum]|uniref:Knottins-like domain-containing protein n=1 Tax=Ensete ventricosum TaxID=4639 RepID=A0A427B835_ENSVE|nr:hypothetical protein B296_00005051 [Ensete ventricosum]RWW11383.1 hypothetical protein GW17_00025015 [Ensete ventricosum]RWW59231.1 hypothetical protein BHE74_00033849 [Ensete ventricosum]RZS11043.1 hypothetical protein BHM03_00042319 [Ensete ventricosum]
MEIKKATIVALLLALLLLASQEEKGVEAKICRLPSIGFRGPCTSDKNCAKVCRREGFDSGDCEGYTMGCLCNKHC